MSEIKKPKKEEYWIGFDTSDGYRISADLISGRFSKRKIKRIRGEK